MAKIEYTPAQRQAVFYPDGNLLISAAAGSGKTAALTGRIVQLITEGRAELSEMLIVTFTKAAASEMKARIGNKIRENIEENRHGDQIVLSRLARGLSQLPSADISTIHSFLYKSLKPYFASLNLSQETVIGEQREIEQLKSEIMRDVVDDFFQKDGKLTYNDATETENNFVELADTIGQARDTTAIDVELLWLYEKLMSMGKSLTTLKEYACELETIASEEIDPIKTKFGELIKRNLMEFEEHYKNVFDEFALEFEGEPKTSEKYGAALETIRYWLRELGTILNCSDVTFEKLKTHFESYVPGKLGRLLAKDATETSENFKIFRDEIKKEIGNLAGNYFSADASDFQKSARKTAKILKTSAFVLEEFEKRLTQRKQAMSIMEYGDLEKYAILLLRDENSEPTKAALEIGARYKYIFVDEYQDTNYVQDRIFTMIGGNAVRFMVGDIKQSIYRFRGADPRVFSEYRRKWSKADDNLCTENNKNTGNSIFMSENFRCSSEIIDFINSVSNTILPHGGIPYEKDDELICGRNDGKSGVPVEVILIDKKKTDNSDSEDDENNDVRTSSGLDSEARYVAARIKNMIGRYSEDNSKIIKPSDVAILLRSPTANGVEYRRALEEMGISASMKTAKSLGEYCSILLLVSLIKFIDNPLRDIFAAGTMKTPIFGFTVDDIVELRKIAGEFPLYTAVLDLAASADLNSSELAQKCEKLTLFVNEEKTVAGGISTEKYLESLINKADIYQLKEVRESAAEGDAIRKVLELAKDFDARNKTITGNKSLHGFIEYLDEILDKPLEGEKQESGDSVSIMSIHASKGLEFPVCFLCDTAKKRNKADETRTILFDDEYGFGMQLPDSTGLVKCDNLIRRTISRKIAVDSVQEEMRMLYVALTRAKGKLIVTAKTADAEKMLAGAQLKAEFADGYTIKKTDSYIDWILGGIIKYQHSPNYKILVVNADDLKDVQNGETNTEETALDTVEIERKVEEIKSRFDFEYPYDFLEKIPSKLIVSRLQPEILDEDGAAEAKIVQYFGNENENISDENSDNVTEADKETPLLKHPNFMIGRKTAAANEIGSATHRFLQFVDFGKLRENGFEAEKQRLTEKKYISKNDAEIINIQQIRRFIQSSLFDSLGRSDFVKREFRFNVLVDAEEFTEDSELKLKLRENQVKITVQGVVDCVYREPESGKLVLVDYKTDSIYSDEWKNQHKAEARLREKHKNQLMYYQRICSEMFEEEITEVYIYSTVLGRCIAV